MRSRHVARAPDRESVRLGSREPKRLNRPMPPTAPPITAWITDGPEEYKNISQNNNIRSPRFAGQPHLRNRRRLRVVRHLL